MQAQLQALQEVQTFLKSQGIDYFVIGGLANAVWGRPRATQDADFKVLPGSLTIDVLVALLAVCRRTPFCSRGILTSPLGNAVRNRGYSYFSDSLLVIEKQDLHSKILFEQQRPFPFPV